MTRTSFIMMIKGCLLALAIASTYAAEDKPQQPTRNAVRNYNGNGRPSQANSKWGNRRRRPMNGNGNGYGNGNGRFRRRNPNYNSNKNNKNNNYNRRPRNPNYQGGSTQKKEYDNSGGYSGNDYKKCDTAELRAACCDLPGSLSAQTKQDICDKVGCDYDQCDWSDDGYDTPEPTSEPTWSADGWQKDGWNDDGYSCSPVSQYNISMLLSILNITCN